MDNMMSFLVSLSLCTKLCAFLNVYILRHQRSSHSILYGVNDDKTSYPHSSGFDVGECQIKRLLIIQCRDHFDQRSERCCETIWYAKMLLSEDTSPYFRSHSKKRKEHAICSGTHVETHDVALLFPRICSTYSIRITDAARHPLAKFRPNW